MTELSIPIIIMLCFVTIEAVILHFIKKSPINWKDIIFNLNSGHMMLWLFRGLELVCFNYVYTHFSLDLFAHIPTIFVWIFALFAWDFGFYWLHRLHHRLRIFWAVHIVHHQGEHFNLSLAVRNSWYSSLTSIPFFALLAIIGVPTYVFVTVSIFHYSIQFFNHNALTPKLGFLELIFVTPAHHRVHHVKDQYYSNRNFGGSFIFWDKLFGSFEPSLPQTEFSYGSYGIQSDNPFWASNLPFMQYFKIPYKPQQKMAAYEIANLQLVLGGLLLFMLVIGYVFTYGYGYSNISVPQYTLFFLMVMGTIALGGISEGRQWAVITWFIMSLLLPLLFLFIWQWTLTYWQVFMSLIALHGTLMLITWIRTRRHATTE